MSDDLVKRLRHGVEGPETGREGADRIEELEAKLALAVELAGAQAKYHGAVTAYEGTPVDRAGAYGPKGTAKTLMLTKYALMQHALACFLAKL